MNTYIFFREGTFYLIELRNDKDAVENAECNKGTLRVEDTNGNIIWELNDKQQSKTNEQ